MIFPRCRTAAWCCTLVAAGLFAGCASAGNAGTGDGSASAGAPDLAEPTDAAPPPDEATLPDDGPEVPSLSGLRSSLNPAAEGLTLTLTATFAARYLGSQPVPVT